MIPTRLLKMSDDLATRTRRLREEDRALQEQLRTLIELSDKFITRSRELRRKLHEAKPHPQQNTLN
jgi:hypothetical protein